MVIILFPLGVDPSSEFLAPAAGGIIWCATALSVLMAVEGMYKEDFNDGLVRAMVNQWSFYYLFSVLKSVSAMVNGHCCLYLIVLPLLAQMLFLPFSALWVVMASILLGTPALFFIGSIGAALTVSLRRGAVLMLLL